MRIGFVIAGVQKAGTTALWKYLRAHPSLFLPECKELHFFDDEAIDWDAPPYERYHQHFAGARPGLACGEATPIYTYWPRAIGRLRDYNPALKLIVILRDPVARAYSHWRMEMARGTETLAFSEAIRSGRQRLQAMDGIDGHNRTFSYVERGFYAEQILSLLSCFDRSQLAFITTNALWHAQRETLDRLCDFLSVTHFATYPPVRRIFSHANSYDGTISGADIDYLRAIFKNDLAETERLINQKIAIEV